MSAFANPAIIGNNGNPAATFDPSTRTFTYNYSADTALGGTSSGGIDYPLTVTADLEGVVSNTGTYDLNIQNPCLRGDYLTIDAPVAGLPDYTYILYKGDPDNKWTHS